MEVLNAAGLTLVSVYKPTTLSNRRMDPRKLLPFPQHPPVKFSKSASFSGSLAFLSSFLSGGQFARALTYEEALGQSMSSSSFGGSFDFDLGGLTDSLLKFGTENKPIVIGGIAVLAVPLVLSLILGKSRSFGVDSARNAYSKLSEDGGSQLLDIRSPKEIREVGSPDLRNLKKKAVSIQYKGDDKQGFLKKLSLRFKEPENTTLFIIDKFDGNSELVGELVTLNGFKAAFAIKDGVEGPRGWLKSGLPWFQRKKALGIDFGELTDTIAGSLGLEEGADALTLTLGLAAATGLGLLAFTEVETALQVLGSVALLQFTAKKLLFADDRKKTLKQVDEFLTTQVAPGEFLDEIKTIGKALLPGPLETKALPPAPVEGNSSTEEVKVEAEVKVETVVKVEETIESPQINSVPSTEVKAEKIPGLQRPLSPYPYYPDYKPPASPSPSKP